MTDTLTCYGDENEAHHYLAANGFVSRCVAPVHHENHPDARRLAFILNEAFAKEPGLMERVDEALHLTIQI